MLDDSGKKLPVNGGFVVDAFHPSNQVRFDEIQEPASIGLIPSNDIVVIDIDSDCPCPNEIVSSLNSWTERSVSGKGFHVIARMSGEFPGIRVRKSKIVPGVEIYRPNLKHWVALTGDHLPETPETVQDATEALLALYGRLFPVNASQSPTAQKKGALKPTQTASSSVIEKIEKRIVKACQTSDAFGSVYLHGDVSSFLDTSSDGADLSSADFYLCKKLAFYTDSDSSLIDLFYRNSGYYDVHLSRQARWESDSYRTNTINRAIADTHQTFAQYIKGTPGTKANKFNSPAKIVQALQKSGIKRRPQRSV